MNISAGELFHRTDVLCGQLKTFSFDILLLQESNIYTVEILCKELNLYVASPTCKIKDGLVKTHCGHCAILLKVGMKFESFSKYLHTGQSITISGIELINIHMIPQKENKKERLNRLLKLDGEKKVLIGDFNMEDDEIIPFKSLENVAVKENNMEPTWRLSYFEQYSTVIKTYDRVYSSVPNVRNFKVHSSLFSDHFPISVELPLNL
jgi:hypothetical protein